MKPGKTPKGTKPEPIRYYDHLLIAYVRGRTGDTTLTTLEDALAAVDLYGWTKDINKFHRKPILPRVQRVIEIVRTLNPRTVIDVGCGRGTALWPMMEAFPGVAFTGTDAYEGRSVDLMGMKVAGITQIANAYPCMASEMTPVESQSQDVATILEVLEHLEEPTLLKAAREMVRITRKAVVFSVPSVKDWNPDHLRLFTEGTLRNLWLKAGAKRVEIFDDVPKHFVGIAYL